MPFPGLTDIQAHTFFGTIKANIEVLTPIGLSSILLAESVLLLHGAPVPCWEIYPIHENESTFIKNIIDWL